MAIFVQVIQGQVSDAGQVRAALQVTQGRGSDPARARELMGQNAPEWAALRPDIIGSVAVEHDGGPTPWRCTSLPRRRHAKANTSEQRGTIRQARYNVRREVFSNTLTAVIRSTVQACHCGAIFPRQAKP